MRTLLAFDSFKDALSATDACQVAADALREIHPDWEIDHAPLTDGGEGFATILTQTAQGTLQPVEVLDARLRPTTAQLGWVDLEKLTPSTREILQLPASGRLAIVELAQASGIEALSVEERDPWQTSSYGTGQLIAEAIRQGADAILLGLGGSATNDLGLGALEALGVCAYDRMLKPVMPLIPAQWKRINSLGGLVNIAKTFPPLRIATDVTNPLLGEQGATAVYGPQKGLKPEDFERFERLIHKAADRILGLFGHHPDQFDARREQPGSGAAGGTGFGLAAAFPDAAYLSGNALIESALSLKDRAAQADLILTGEGAFDLTSLQGKGPASLIPMKQTQAHLHFFSGRVLDAARQQIENDPTLHVHPISPPNLPLNEALPQTAQRLAEAIHRQFT